MSREALPPVKDCPFSEDEIKRLNWLHDRRYGWTMEFSTIYTNLGRFPETVIGRLPWSETTPCGLAPQLAGDEAADKTGPEPAA